MVLIRLMAVKWWNSLRVGPPPTTLIPVGLPGLLYPRLPVILTQFSTNMSDVALFGRSLRCMWPVVTGN